jgi:TPR repeat protein
VHAFYPTGCCYLYGSGTEVSNKLAFEYLSKAVKHGDLQAYSTLASLYQTGTGCDQSDENAIEILKQGVELLDADSMYELGLCYENGYGVQKSIQEALKYYKQAEVYGNTQATEKVALCLRSVDNYHPLNGFPDGDCSTTCGNRALFGSGVLLMPAS